VNRRTTGLASSDAGFKLAGVVCAALLGWTSYAADPRAGGTLLKPAPAAQEKSPVAKPELKPPGTVAELQQRLTELVAEPRFAAALWGVKIVSLDSGKLLFEHNAQKLFSPASNSKLYTVALALDRLGPDYRIKTSLYAKARPDQTGTLNGDLLVYGRGDPTVNARVHGGDIYQALEPLISALTNAGVRRVTGDLVGDASFISGPEFGSGWSWDDQEYYYGAEISALTINDNTLQTTVKPGDHVGAPCQLALSLDASYVTFSNRTETVAPGSRRALNFFRVPSENIIYVSGQMPLDAPPLTEEVTLHNPAGLFVSLLKEAMTRHGIQVDGKPLTVNWVDRLGRAAPPTGLAGAGRLDGLSNLVDLGSMESLPMRTIAREVMKPSQNLYTDLLLAHVGERTRAADTPADRTSEDLGIRELNRFLGEAGVKRGDVFFEEGSGLSRDNLTTPNATVALLQFMSRHKSADVYLQAMPIAGVDGTLRNRMKGTPAAGNLRGKTGTLRWANSLSGHVTTAAGERLVFSLMLNRYHSIDPGHSARAELDAIGVMLAGFSQKTGASGQ
jgi:serine-type D-Ala-D-Ala carboxypeptidase/endopeptidase (penicillin-binding protein 4)